MVAGGIREVGRAGASLINEGGNHGTAGLHSLRQGGPHVREEERQSIRFCWGPWSFPGGQEALETTLVQGQTEKVDSAEGMKTSTWEENRKNNRCRQLEVGAVPLGRLEVGLGSWSRG